MADRSAAFSARFDPESGDAGRRADLRDIMRCRGDWKPFAGKMILLLLAACGCAVSLAEIPRHLGKLIDLFVSAVIDAVLREAYTPDTAAVLRCAIPVAVLLFVFALLQDLTCRLAADVSTAYTHALRGKAFDKLLRVRMDYLDTHAKSSVHALLTERIDVLGQSLELLLYRVVYALILLPTLVIAAARVSPRLGILLLVVILLFALVRLMQNAGGRAAEPVGAPPGVPDTAEVYRNLSVLHCSGKVQSLSDAICRAEANRMEDVRKMRFADSVGPIASALLTGLAVAATILLAVYSGDPLRIGTLVTAVLYIRRAEKALSDISFFSASLRNMAVAAGSVYDFLGADEESDAAGGICPKPEEANEICFRNVCFAYTAGSREVLRDLSFTVRDRGVTVIRGVTGAGKTTVLKLLTGFYRPQGGNITRNGVDIAQLDLRAYRGLFAVIVQEASLFERTIAENITYPDAQADPERITAVLERIGWPHLADALPDGLQTVFVPHSGLLSEGQIQLVLIARALYHDKRFLILDESLSHLDEESTAGILRVLRDVSADTGVILVSHRNLHLPADVPIVEILV